MKKLAILMLAFTAHVAHAAHPAHASRAFSGFYVHGALGATLLDMQVDQSFTIDIPGQVFIDLPAVINLGDGGIAGWAGVGYSHQFSNQLALGLEVTGGYATPEVGYRDEFTTGAFFDGHFQSELTNDFAVLFKIGYVSRHRTHIYAMVGPRWGNFESTLSTDLIPPVFVEETSGYQLGITAGVGMEQMLTRNLSLGLEYAYTSYGSLDAPVFYLELPGGTVNDKVDLKASTNTLGARLSYHF